MLTNPTNLLISIKTKKKLNYEIIMSDVSIQENPDTDNAHQTPSERSIQEASYLRMRVVTEDPWELEITDDKENNLTQLDGKSAEVVYNKIEEVKLDEE